MNFLFNICNINLMTSVVLRCFDEHIFTLLLWSRHFGF